MFWVGSGTSTCAPSSWETMGGLEGEEGGGREEEGRREVGIIKVHVGVGGGVRAAE